MRCRKVAAGVDEGIALLAGNREKSHVAEAVSHLLGDVEGLPDSPGEGAAVEAVGEIGWQKGGKFLGTGQWDGGDGGEQAAVVDAPAAAAPAALAVVAPDLLFVDEEDLEAEVRMMDRGRAG